MTDLTEQWKKGELPEGHYYIKTRNETNIDEYIQWYKDHGIPSEKSFAYFNVQQVLAPVPSYEEWQALKASYEMLNDANLKQATWMADMEKENAQLKELLNECRPYFDALVEKRLKLEYIPQVYELLTKINEVLK